MDTTRGAGVVCTAVGVAGYLLGIAVPYPGRALSVTAVMVGVTLFAVGRGAVIP